MMMDGKKIAKELWVEIHHLVATLERVPELHIVWVQGDAPSKQFVVLKERCANEAGIPVIVHAYDEGVTTEKLVQAITGLSAGLDPADGIIVQLPLPPQVDQAAVLNALAIEHDSDLLKPETQQAFRSGIDNRIPPVAGAVAVLGQAYGIDFDKGQVVLHGYGGLVGQACALWLDRLGVPYDIIDIHTHQQKRADLLMAADIIISGTGVAGSIALSEVNDHVVIFDAGTSESAGQLVGDVDIALRDQVRLVSPVPGGIGPITVAVLFMNLLHNIPKTWLSLNNNS